MIGESGVAMTTRKREYMIFSTGRYGIYVLVTTRKLRLEDVSDDMPAYQYGRTYAK